MTSPLDRIDDLSKWLAEAGLGELELSGPDGSVRLVRGRAVSARSEIAEPAAKAMADASRDAIASPMVGVFLTAHPLRADPLVRPDETVKAGQTVALLRIGALLVPVAAQQDGIVGVPLAAEGALVGFGEPLIEFTAESQGI